jgi:glyceraldehyde-3-phosphate dehydrogenase (NADP+)
MKIGEKIRTVFPEDKDIPERCLLKAPIKQDVYLVDGELRHWDGLTQEVLSPVCVWEFSRLVQKFIGDYPLLTEKESSNVLDAAVNFG